MLRARREAYGPRRPVLFDVVFGHDRALGLARIGRYAQGTTVIGASDGIKSRFPLNSSVRPGPSGWLLLGELESAVRRRPLDPTNAIARWRQRAR